jgi:SAM-dependent methyltransferase
MAKISDIVRVFRANGLLRTLGLILRKLARWKISSYRIYQDLFYNKHGIEIGGPSALFQNKVPIYSKIASLDGVNFSTSTIWEGEIREGEYFRYGKGKLGYQFICDAVNLERIESGKYDFVLSSNNLEHIANPLKALAEWLRIIKPYGLLFLVVPDKVSNFDHNRKVTSLEHLLEDFENDTSEDDLTHLGEILSLHDLSMDPPAGDSENFKKRSMNNFRFRCLHHHVFDMDLLEQLFKHLDIEILREDHTETDFLILGRKR